ncbi:MAG TPA: metallophosphoesterase [Verrucomicrobiae bacterium]|nr:metallophosphoesterase [Verrucomicrobiae bacterium]
MKCLLVSDLHYALKQYDWVTNVSKDFDVVVIAGDHLDISSAVEARAQIAVILTYLKRLHTRTKLIVCSGNHDLDALNDAGEKVSKWITKVRQFGAPTDGDSLSIDGVFITICPWWDGPQTRETVGAQLARDAEKPKEQWIWVYHAPPDESPTSWGGQKHFGDAASWCVGSNNTSRTSSSAATSTSLLFAKAGLGWTGWAPLGSSILDGR